MGSFLPGDGVGGAGVHWNGQQWRALPEDLRIRRHYEERYGKRFIPADMTIQDFGVGYDELETHFDHFEKVCGVSGKRSWSTTRRRTEAWSIGPAIC